MSKLVEYKIVSGNSLTDLEIKVNYFLDSFPRDEYRVHGDIQMYSYSEFVQVLVRNL
jgi:hypothetical protein